jgi:uncharacterized protein with FMN-binding domain
MPRWVICSSILLLGASTGWAQERLTQAEALRLAFPAPATIERRTAYLGEREVATAGSLAGSDVEISQRVVTYYVGLDRGVPVGAAYFDSHVVRTKVEVAMVVVDREGRVRQVEVLHFDEPPEYRASAPWLAQLKGKQLSADLSLKGDILNLTGASLTSRALVRATRRVLALHQVIRPFNGSR